MARYEHLPIYRDTFKLYIYCETIVRNFSRYHKYSTGQDLRDLVRKVLRLIIRANHSPRKPPVLEEMRITVAEVRLMIHICKEVKAFQNFKSFETAVNQVTNISRQAEGWYKYAHKRENGRNPGTDGST